MNDNYIPRFGDTVKITGLRNDDAYSTEPDKHIGRVVKINSNVRNAGDGCYGFGTECDETYYAAHVDEYIEPNKQILVVIGGVTFFSLPVGPCEAKMLLESIKRAAPNTDPMIVIAN